VDFEELRCRDRHDAVPSGGTARGEMVEDVGGTADVVVVRYAAADPHATVERRCDEDDLVVTARSVEALPLTVLFARRCSIIIVIIIRYLERKIA